MSSQEKAIQEFTIQATFDFSAREIFEGVLRQAPVSIMFVYEQADGSIGIATAPGSFQLARGLSDAAYDALWSTPEVDETDEDDIP
jgi:hypothetical protein